MRREAEEVALSGGLAGIAEAAGVSISTVSRVLNRRPGVHEETRRRVLSALAEQRYTPRGIDALHRTGVLGLLVPELTNPVFPAFAEALEARAAERGYSTVLCNTKAASAREEEHVRLLLARGVAGMVFVSPESTDSLAPHGHYKRLREDGVSMVFVNGGMPTLDVPDVCVDEQVAGYIATRHLVELGHQRIGFVSGPARSVPTRLKRAGWQAALEEAGLDAEPELVAHAEYGAAGGAAAARRLLDAATPTALVCASDVMAFGALSEARRRGLAVPRDLSVVGFDDTPMAPYASPPLTTLAQPIAEMARAAVDGLVAEIEEEGAGGGTVHSRVFRPRLVERESTAPPV
jgi:DNA-binding LacI/PurR family transcriptional regulator